MNKIRIGTRNSPLAIWQAQKIKNSLQELGVDSVLVPIVSSGDKNLEQPLYAMGIVGVFTKDLDVALLRNEIDIAVHSLKDMPTLLPKGICLSAVLQRDFVQDVLVCRKDASQKELSEMKIATSSLRRRSFWKNKFPQTEFCDIRGNIQTRLEKLEKGIADATMLSLAGLKRMNLDIAYREIPFLLSAPSQGVVACSAREEDTLVQDILRKINHKETCFCTKIERDFLRCLEGGCTAPIGAFAFVKGDELHFHGKVSSLDGKETAEIRETIVLNTQNESEEPLGIIFAKKIRELGAERIMQAFTKQNQL